MQCGTITEQVTNLGRRLSRRLSDLDLVPLFVEGLEETDSRHGPDQQRHQEADLGARAQVLRRQETRACADRLQHLESRERRLLVVLEYHRQQTWKSNQMI